MLWRPSLNDTDIPAAEFIFSCWMEVSFPENQAVSQLSTEAHSMSYKLLGIQRGTEPCLTVFLHRAFLTASFQSKLSKWCCRAHSRCKVSVWGFFTTVLLSRKINFCFGSQLSSVKPGEKCHCFQHGLDQVRALYISLCFSFQQQAQTGFLWLFQLLYITNWRSGHQKISILIFWWIVWLFPESWSQSQGSMSLLEPWGAELQGIICSVLLYPLPLRLSAGLGQNHTFISN